MTSLLQAFVAQMDVLARDGISWNAGGQLVNSKVYFLTCVADAPARAALQNTVQYNGYYVCSWCLHPGEYSEGCVRYPVSTEVVPDRTESRTISHMAVAASSGRTVKGIKGPSPLLNIPGFDIVWEFYPDYVHCALLGVARQFCELWFSSPGEDYYIGDPQNVFAVSLQNLKPP